MVSIQSLILVEKPYFNGEMKGKEKKLPTVSNLSPAPSNSSPIQSHTFLEPGYENQMNSDSGKRANKEYNDNIRLQTLKWAINNQLKNPSAGYAEVIKAHFKLKKQIVMKEITRWQQQSDRQSEFEPEIALFKKLTEDL